MPEPVTVIVPTYNECRNLPVLVERLRAALTKEGRAFECLVVDDDSPDGTAEVGRGLGPDVRTLVRVGERGLATAVIWGLRHAKHELCVVMDADLSHDPAMVPSLAAAVEGGAPFALGSRYAEGGRMVDWSLLRWVNSIGATVMARPLTRAADPMSGFFCCRRDAVPLDQLNPTGFKIALEILVKAGISQPVEVPITFTDRLHGSSKLDFAEQVAYVTHLIRLYKWRWPLLTEFVLFCIVGTVGLVFDLAIITALVESGVWFGWARIAGFAAAVSSNFVLNDRFTFEGAGKVPLGQRYARFVLTSSAGLAINYVTSMLLYGNVAIAREYYWLAAIGGVLAGTLVNFAGARMYAFRKTE